eukprot:COSAG06_NODE_1410_length_9546_cov_102.602519_5_plen_244_part_00
MWINQKPNKLDKLRFARVRGRLSKMTKAQLRTKLDETTPPPEDQEGDGRKPQRSGELELEADPQEGGHFFKADVLHGLCPLAPIVHVVPHVPRHVECVRRVVGHSLDASELSMTASSRLDSLSMTLDTICLQCIHLLVVEVLAGATRAWHQHAAAQPTVAKWTRHRRPFSSPRKLLLAPQKEGQKACRSKVAGSVDRVWNTSSFVILTAAYSIQPYFVDIGVPRLARSSRNQPAAAWRIIAGS